MRTIIFTVVLFLSLAAYGQKTVTGYGEYTYYVPENVTLEQARSIAIERARLDAIAKVFGTNVSQTNTVSVRKDGELSETVFNSFGGTEVKGDWIADSKKPEVNVRYDGGMVIVEVKVWGKIRENPTGDYDLSVQVLCNGTVCERFIDCDRLSVCFKSSVKGFLSIFLVDENANRAYCLLPYENEDGKARAISQNKTYMLLSTDDPLYPYHEETILTADKPVEYNRLVFIFSKNQFSMPLADMGCYLPELPASDFVHWIQKNRLKDVEMRVIEKVVEINK